MKKYVLFFYLTLCICKGVFAQSYTVEQIPFIPFAFNTGDTLVLSDDQYSRPIPIGFDFCFFGQSYDSIRISSNSYITFTIDTGILGQYSPWNISGTFPDSASLTNVIMFPWQDLNTGAGGEIRYNLYGVTPWRKFVVSFDSIPMFSCTGSFFSNQLVLYEGSNVIETYIANKPLCGTWNDGQAVHGLQNADRTEAVIIPGRNVQEQWQASNDAWKFTPLACTADSNNCTLFSDTSFTLISGKLYVDSNDNCIYDGAEIGLANKLITVSPGNVYAYTNEDGEYNIFVFDTGMYQLNFNIPVDMQFPQCSQNQVHVTALDDSIAYDLIMETIECSSLRGHFSMGSYTPCDTFEFYLTVSNEGTIPSGNTTIGIDYSDQFQILNCDCNFSISLNYDSLLIYIPDGLMPDENYTATIQAIVPCNMQGMGMMCIEGWSVHETQICTDVFEHINLGCSDELIGVDDHVNEKVSVYPNPSTGFLIVSGMKEKGYLMQLLDLTGRVLNTYKLIESSTTLTIDEFSAGLYIFSITDSKGNSVGNGKIRLAE